MGKPVRVRDANQVDTDYTYDGMGRPLTVTRNPGASQSHYAMAYDAAGNLTRLTLPMGGWLEYTYDGASRVTAIENDSGEKITFMLNALGQPTAEQTLAPGGAIARASTRAYDELGRMIQSAGAGGQTWQYAYDKVGNLTSTTDARGKVWSATVDNHNRPKTQTNPQAQTETRAWSQADGMTQFKDGRNLATDTVIDGFGNVIREVSPDRGITDYSYDEADRVTQVTDADGTATAYTYDAAGRTLTEASSKPGLPTQTVSYSYDDQSGGNKGKGRLTGASDPSGSAAMVWDEQGRMAGRSQTVGARSYTLGYSHDAGGAVTSITYPSGHVVDYARAADGRVTAVKARASAGAAQVDLATSLSYKPFGPLAGLTYGNGLALTRTYDQNYWLTGIGLSGTPGTLIAMNIARDANGNVSAVTDSAAPLRNAAYAYSDAGRLAAASGVWGADAYTYDANGNRTRADRTISGSTFSDVATIPATSNRLTEIRDGAGVLARAYAYSAGGDREALVPSAGAATSYAYDARGRLASVTSGATLLASYAYDYREQRVPATIPGTGEVALHLRRRRALAGRTRRHHRRGVARICLAGRHAAGDRHRHHAPRLQLRHHRQPQ